MNKQFSQAWLVALLSLALGVFAVEAQARKTADDSAKPDQRLTQTTYNTVKIDGLDIFYREAGDPSKPTILLLHGFPTSSHMFRNLIPALADRFHLVAPDYPGFGQSSAPAANEFNYTFDNLANIIDKFTNTIGLKKYSLYVQDYGAPVGFRLALKNPGRVQTLIVQNGNAYEEGLSEAAAPLKTFGETRDPKIAEVLRGFLKQETTKFQYTQGARRQNRISPDTWTHDQALLDRPGNAEIQLALFADYSSNIESYPAWHEYLRKHQPPTLIVWGRNDPFFTVKNIDGFRRDLKNVEVHLLDGGHFALEEYTGDIAEKICNFFAAHKIK
ncbi:MAG: alpha/beta hydrolase [Acidobacteria bacterium]|nr:alpha/beta hydrolase [Acidobacteriota bacterium]MBI3421759.1 alpha/beta hydrolase [Acidobacteriota bacterium]